MENFIIYGLVALFVLFNIFRTYRKENSKNKKRMMNQPRPRLVPDQTSASPQETPPPAPFSRKSLLPKEEPVVSTLETITPEVVAPEVTTSFYTAETVVKSVVEKKKKVKEKHVNVSEEQFNIIELQLNSKEDLRRAFLHSIILERKY